MPSHWPRPGIPEYGPRVVRFTRATRVGIALVAGFGVACLLGGLGLLSYKAEKDQSLLREGRVVPAEIVDKRIQGGDERKYRLYYRFTVAGTTVDGKRGVGRDVYEATPIGSTVDVTVLPSKPSVHRFGRLSPEQARREMVEGGLIVFLLLASFGGLAGLIQYLARREARILTDWVATSAEVLSASRSVSANQGATQRIRLRYRVPREAPIEADARLTTRGSAILEPGSFVDVLFDPENPTRFRLRAALTSVEIDPGS